MTITVQKTKVSKPFDLRMESKTILLMFSSKRAGPGAGDSGRRRINHLTLSALTLLRCLLRWTANKCADE